jgi:molybdenum cofactor synthesis domain-containing protein
MAVNLEVICVGNELLIGKVSNTNAQWLGKQATNLGVNVSRITVVQDIVEEIAGVIHEVLARKLQFIILTGGLGPTFDDKTLQGLAVALGVELEVNLQARGMVKDKIMQYAQTHQLPVGDMTPARTKMATLPRGTQPVFNPVGTAPGVRADVEGAVVFALPGVPAEMMAIFMQTIVPLLRRAVGDLVFCEKSMFVDELIESRLAPLIDVVMRDNAGVYIKSHPMGGGGRSHIEVHLTLRAKREENPAEKLDRAMHELAGLIGENGGLVGFG